MSITTTIVLEHTTPTNLKVVADILDERLMRLERALEEKGESPTNNAEWAALFNMLCDLEQSGYEL